MSTSFLLQEQISQFFINLLFSRIHDSIESSKGDREGEKIIPFYQAFLRLDENLVKIILSTSFWASLRIEEGRFNNFKVSVLPKEEYKSLISDPDNFDFFKFESEKDFSSDEISDLAGALSPDKSIAAWVNPEGKIKIWGVVKYPTGEFEVQSIEPGKLKINIALDRFFLNGESHGKIGSLFSERIESYFNRGKSLEGSLSDIILQSLQNLHIKKDSSETVLRPFITKISKVGLLFSGTRIFAKEMIKHKRGGCVAIVPSSNNASWYDCISSFRYKPEISYKPAQVALSELINASDSLKNPFDRFINPLYLKKQEKFESELVELAAFTMVDGASIVDTELCSLGFGAKFRPRSEDKPTEIYRVSFLNDESLELIDFKDIGGTRHQSAGQFIFDNRECLAIVCSQDGRLSIFSWDSTNNYLLMTTDLEYEL